MVQKPLKIAFIGTKSLPARGGADRVVEAIASRLACRHQITIYCSARLTAKDAQIDGVRLVRLPCPAGKYTHMTTVDLLAAWHALILRDYSIIHLNLIEASFILPLLKLRYPVVATAHGRISAGSKWGVVGSALIRLMELPFTVFANARTSVSMPDARALSLQYRRDVAFIPNGVDPDPQVDLEAAKEMLASHNLVPGEYVLFAAGRLIPLKGADLLLDAYSRVAAKLPLLIVGDLAHSPEYASRLKAQADPRVAFMPFVASRATLYGLMHLSRLFVFPSLSEGMSITLLEAASVGVPILCSDIPANRTALEDAAVYFSSGDACDLAERLGWALDHPREMARRAARLEKLVSERYSWDIVASQYEKVYEQVVGA